MRDNVTIAIIAPIQPEDFFDLLWQGVWEATFDLSSFAVEVQNLATDYGDICEQRKMLEILLESQPDAIGLMPGHVSALNDLIDEHVLHGTPVITFHSDAPDSKRVAFVRPDPYQAGTLAGEVLAKLIHGQGRVLAFPGPLEKFHYAQRYEGFRAALLRYEGRIEERPCLLGTQESHNIAPSLFETSGDITGCYVGNQDILSIAAIFETQGIRMPCVAFSNTEQVRSFVERGLVSAVIDENRYQIGYFAVQKAYEAILKRDEGAPVASVQIPSTVVFAANAASTGVSPGSAFEMLVRQRTEILLSYKKRLEEANAKLLDLAITDPLTGLYNRRKFEESLNNEVSRALRYGPVSLLLIDLDYFKLINDHYGHQTGDDVLKAVARTLLACCRATDTCARLGGDEFAVILPHSDSSAAAVVRQRIQEQVARTLVPTGEDTVTISLSIGVASLPDDADNVESLVAAADAAMYQAKQAARSENVPAIG